MHCPIRMTKPPALVYTVIDAYSAEVEHDAPRLHGMPSLWIVCPPAHHRHSRLVHRAPAFCVLCSKAINIEIRAGEISEIRHGQRFRGFISTVQLCFSWFALPAYILKCRYRRSVNDRSYGQFAVLADRKDSG